MKTSGHKEVLQEDYELAFPTQDINIPNVSTGVKQTEECRDSFFAALFVIQLILILGPSFVAYYQFLGTDLNDGRTFEQAAEVFSTKAIISFTSVYSTVATLMVAVILFSPRFSLSS
uniref:Uncharacterized protein n=1 Tax=Corethron hystrix TaxID=216773 RepID=A0A7S1G0T4_9STRA